MHKPDPIGEIDLAAYVDDQLDAERRIEVEAWLAANPQAAANVMADLRARDALRLLAADRAPVSGRLAAAAGRLDRALSRRAMWSLAPRMAVAASAVALVSLLGVELAGGLTSPAEAAPRYVAEAAMAHRVALVRAGMASQPEVPRMDAEEMQRVTGLAMPKLPAGWRVLDAQLFPSDDGPSLQMTVDRGDGEPVSLFAVRAQTGAPEDPLVVRDGKEAVAYWQEGELAMALTGDEPEAELDAVAGQLARATAG